MGRTDEIRNFDAMSRQDIEVKLQCFSIPRNRPPEFSYINSNEIPDVLSDQILLSPMRRLFFLTVEIVFLIRIELVLHKWLNRQFSPYTFCDVLKMCPRHAKN